MNIVMLGAPGSGKGTQGKQLAQHLGVPHVSTGDLLRQLAAQDTPLAREVAGIMQRGELVSDQLLAQVLRSRLESREFSSGFVLDGTPRDIEQAHIIERIVPVHAAVFIEVPDEKVAERLTARWICPADSKEYNALFAPPKREGVCDLCGTALSQRADDTHDGVQKRLSIYHEKTQPVLRYYSLKGKLVHVNGDQPIEAVFSELLEKVQAIQPETQTVA